jgi:hypothetical protein
MDIIDFLGMNVILVGGMVLLLTVYLIFLIKKKRANSFTHKKQ